MQKIATMTKGPHLLDTMTEETTGHTTSMSGTTTTEFPPGTTPPPAPGITLPPAGTMTDTMIQEIGTMRRGRDTMRIGMETGMVLRPGLTTTDPQFQEGTTMTPQIMKGMRDIQRVKAATTAAPEGAEALCRLQGGTIEGKKSKLSDYVTGVTRIWKEDRIQKTYKSCPFKRSLRNQDVDRMHQKMDETIANS